MSYTFEIIDNFIPKSLEDKLEKMIQDIPWYYQEKIAVFDQELYDDPNVIFENPNITDASAFTHLVYGLSEKINSEIFYELKNILYFLEHKTKMEIKELLRIRLRLSTPTPGHKLGMYNPPHVDILGEKQYYTFVYYLNDSDGDTVLFDKKYEFGQEKLTKENPALKPIFANTPKKGTGLFFDGLLYHSGNSPVNYNTRCIANFDFRI